MSEANITIIDAARILYEYCQDRHCEGCAFERAGDDCSISCFNDAIKYMDKDENPKIIRAEVAKSFAENYEYEELNKIKRLISEKITIECRRGRFNVIIPLDDIGEKHADELKEWIESYGFIVDLEYPKRLSIGWDYKKDKEEES